VTFTIIKINAWFTTRAGSKFIFLNSLVDNIDKLLLISKL